MLQRRQVKWATFGLRLVHPARVTVYDVQQTLADRLPLSKKPASERRRRRLHELSAFADQKCCIVETVVISLRFAQSCSVSIDYSLPSS